MTDERCWVALVTFERVEAVQDIQPEWARGVCGWMVALAPDEQVDRQRLVRDVELQGLRALDIPDEREVFGDDEIEEIDEHLAANVRKIEPGAQTVWGTIHGYKDEGEARKLMAAFHPKQRLGLQAFPAGEGMRCKITEAHDLTRPKPIPKAVGEANGTPYRQRVATGYRKPCAVAQPKHEPGEATILLRPEANLLEDQIAPHGHDHALAAYVCHSRKLAHARLLSTILAHRCRRGRPPHHPNLPSDIAAQQLVAGPRNSSQPCFAGGRVILGRKSCPGGKVPSGFE